MTVNAIGSSGHILPLPPDNSLPTYLVQSGDSLQSIADAHHTTVQVLAQLNHLDLQHPHAVVIQPGQCLQLPPPTEVDQPSDDPVVQALNNYEQVAASTRNSQIIAAHAHQDPGDPGLQLNLDRAQTQLDQALEFQAAAHQRAGAAVDPNEINSLVQHYGGLAPFANNSSVQSGLSNAASGLNAPEANAVDKIFSQVTAPTTDSNARETQFANALAGQPAEVVDAVRNDPRYQPLVNQFADAAVGSSGSLPVNRDQPTVAAWDNQAQQNLSSLADMLNGRTGISSGLPPSIAADIIKLPQTQTLISNVLTSNQLLGSPGSVASQQALGRTLPGSFQSMSRIADSLGANTPAANQFTQQVSGQIIGVLQAANVPPSAYSRDLDVQHQLGASPTGMGTQASPALAIAIAQQMQANGDGKDAQGMIGDVCSAVNNVATSSGSYTTSVTQALSDYQTKTADLNWLVANLGGGATPAQLNTAVQNYITKQGPAWQAAYKQDQQTLKNSARFLANDIAQLQSLPDNLKTPEVNSTLKSLAGNKSIQQALGFALQNDPVSILGKSGSQANPLLQFFKLDSGSAKLATAVTQTYIQTQFQPALLKSLSGLAPGTPQYSQALHGNLENFVQQHPAMTSLVGIDENSISNLSNMFAPKTPDEDLKTTVSSNLKQFANSSQPMLKSMALLIGTNGLFKALKTSVNDPSAGNIFSACTTALGYTQSAASVALLFNSKISSDNPFVAFGKGNSDWGKLSSKLLNAVGVFTNLQSLGSDISGGNTVGLVGVSLNLAASGVQSDAAKDAVKSTVTKWGLESIGADSAASFLDPMAGALMWGSTLISAGQMLFTEGPHPPSSADQLSFLKDLGYGGLSQNALWDLVQQTSNNTPSGAPGSSPLMLLTKYAQDKGYDLQDPSQRNAFVNWVNQLAATPDSNNAIGAVGPAGQPVNQLATLAKNLDAELDYTKGDVSSFAPADPGSDRNFGNVMGQTGRVQDLISSRGPNGISYDPSSGSSPLITADLGPGDAGVIAPQSAVQIDQLLKVLGASGLPAPPSSTG